MANHQNRARGGDGWLRIMEFSPAHNHIRTPVARVGAPNGGDVLLAGQWANLQWSADDDASGVRDVDMATSAVGDRVAGPLALDPVAPNPTRSSHRARP
jgi:hypothetical protein